MKKIILCLMFSTLIFIYSSSAANSVLAARNKDLNPSQLICPGEILHQTTLVILCRGCGTQEFTINYLGIENSHLKFAYGGELGAKKILNVPLNSDNKAFLNLISFEITLEIAIDVETKCITYQETEFIWDYPKRWYLDGDYQKISIPRIYHN